MCSVVTLPSVLWRCWLGGRKGIWPIKTWVMRCWHGYLSEAKWKWLAYCPADATATPSYLLQKIQNGLSFWYRPTQVVLEKRPLNDCVCVCMQCSYVIMMVFLYRDATSLVQARRHSIWQYVGWWQLLVSMDAGWQTVLWILQIPRHGHNCQSWVVRRCRLQICRRTTVSVPSSERKLALKWLLHIYGPH